MRQPRKSMNRRANLLGQAAVLSLALALGGLPSPAQAQAQTQAQPQPPTKAEAEAETAAAAKVAAKQESFASAADATTALIAALTADNTNDLLKILGPGGEKLVVTGDPVAAKASREKFLALYAEHHTLQTESDGSVTIVAGNDDWPMPIPIAQAGGKWRFDSTIGAQVIVEREIGRNELKTIQTLYAAVDAQKDYFDRMKAADGAGLYAQQLYSTPGTHNGLYWDVAAGEEESPLGPLVEQVENEGYPGATRKDGTQTPYHGYYFRLLTAQGPDSPEGTEDYISDGKMTGGFAYVAWPAIYGRSGIMSFIVNQDGNVFQKDLGPDTTKEAEQMKLFNPDLSWALVQPTD